MTASRKWICSQIGARQHYSVPFALHQRGVLDSLITDIWFPPKSLPARLNRNLAGRFHPGLKCVRVRALNDKALVFEAVSYLRGLNGWELMQARNQWFQEHAVAELPRQEKGAALILHSFSYAA